jgi:hypothetical protein
MPGPPSDAELAVAERTRERFGPPLSAAEKNTARVLCAGGTPTRVNVQLLRVVQGLLQAERPPLTVAVLHHLRDDGEERTQRLAELDAAYKDLYEVLSKNEKARFLYVNVPPASSEGEPGKERTLVRPDGCAILWGGAFRRGVVAAQPVPWAQLRATVLDALSATGAYETEDVIKAFLR